MQVSDLFANKKQRSVPLLSLPRWRTMSQSGRSFAPQIVLQLRFWAGQRTLLLWAPPATAIDGRWWFMQDYNAEHQIPSDLWSSLLDGNVIPCGRKTTVVGLSLTFACNGGFELEEMRRADRRMGTDVPRSVAPPSLPASSIYDLHKSYQNVTFIKIPSKIWCDHLCWLELLISPEVLALVSRSAKIFWTATEIFWEATEMSWEVPIHFKKYWDILRSFRDITVGNLDGKCLLHSRNIWQNIFSPCVWYHLLKPNIICQNIFCPMADDIIGQDIFPPCVRYNLL